jgi:AmmeMemoRadiSam system protein A
MSSREPVSTGGPDTVVPSLRAIARRSIEHGLRANAPLDVEPGDYPPPLCERGASFVTLRLEGELRGCTGMLEATRPLVCDVAHNAFRSAFGDPRFPPLRDDELPRLDVHVAVLSPLEPLPAETEQGLLRALRPGIDGLVLREGARSATFLPAVWESLPEPEDFLGRLREKAGLPFRYWSPSLRFERYTARDAD